MFSFLLLAVKFIVSRMFWLYQIGVWVGCAYVCMSMVLEVWDIRLTQGKEERRTAHQKKKK